MSRKALLTFSVGPVHTFIVQSRRVADLWTGSEVLSHLVRSGLHAGCEAGATPVFPAVNASELPDRPFGVPNRFVCRVPEERASEIARTMDEAVRAAWKRLVEDAVEELEVKGLAPTRDEIYGQTEAVFDIAWSWVPEEDGGYAAAARRGAERWNAVRRFRPFPQSEQELEKCAVCGERTALPDGVRENVRTAWQKVEDDAKQAKDEDEERFFRFSQSRLCLVCATKRLYTKGKDRSAYFSAFDRFQPDDDRTYFALIALDGDRMGDVLNWSDDKVRGDLETFHRVLSQALTDFAESLRGTRPWQLATERLGLEEGVDLRKGKSPQLVYAGGEDVMVVCDPRDAVAIARKIRDLYTQALAPVADCLSKPEDLAKLTLSGAILFAHTKYPAGLAFREVNDLLARKAKREAGRNALALRLVKRGGVPVETAFHWEEKNRSWVDELSLLVQKVNDRELSSKQTYALRGAEETLAEVFKERHWQPWVEDRLRRNGATAEGSHEMAGIIAPFLETGRGAALRIVRFLGTEMTKEREGQEETA